MGLLGKAAAKAGEKVKRASKHYCPATDNHKHRMGSHRNADLPEEAHRGGPHHGITHVTYCKACGWTDHKR